MDTIEAVIIGVGRGRGSATNVPERALIEQVRLKPLLYDKNVKDYRKVHKKYFYFDHNFLISISHLIAARSIRLCLDRSCKCFGNIR